VQLEIRVQMATKGILETPERRAAKATMATKATPEKLERVAAPRLLLCQPKRHQQNNAI
jgi:hypothetical protein